MKKTKMNAQDVVKMFSHDVTVEDVIEFNERTGADVILEDGEVRTLHYGS